jgi:hypothetical protein
MKALIQTAWSFAAITLGLAWLLAKTAHAAGLRRLGIGWVAACVVTAGLAANIPISGLPWFRCAAGYVPQWSVPLLAVLAADLWAKTGKARWFRRQDWRAAWVFGTVGGLALYPMALGLGQIDPYSLGWSIGPFTVVMALVSGGLLWRGNRFGIVLVLAAAAWQLGVNFSGNLWDCLVDPFYFLAGVAGLGVEFIRHRRTHLGVARPLAAGETRELDKK